MAARSVTSPDVASRRSLLRAGLAGLAGLALGALGRPGAARAAAGDPIVMGVSNAAGTSNTSLTTSSTGTALQVTQNGAGTALRGVAASGIAGFFTSTTGSGVSGVVAHKDKFGVYGANDAESAGAGAAVRAAGKQNAGLVATTDNSASYAIRASNGGSAAGNKVAVLAYGAGATAATLPALDPAAGHFVGKVGVIGATPTNITNGNGVYGFSRGSSASGVIGQVISETGSTLGVFGLVDSSAGIGVRGLSMAADGLAPGVQGECFSSDPNCAGVIGISHLGPSSGVYGYALSQGGYGVIGTAPTASVEDQAAGVFGGISGNSGAGCGVLGSCNSPDGYGVMSIGHAYVTADLHVAGSIYKTGGTFKIDHPLDPANKYLYHSFVESPDRKNVYDGVVTLDAKGEATVRLPDWFEALNRDLRYQLTPIGRGATDLHVESEVKDGSFAIAGGAPNQRVCWMVTGVRKDAWAEAHPLAVEEPKPAAERGLYLHPVEHGAPASKGLGEVRRARLKKIAAPVVQRPDQ